MPLDVSRPEEISFSKGFTEANNMQHFSYYLFPDSLATTLLCTHAWRRPTPKIIQDGCSTLMILSGFTLKTELPRRSWSWACQLMDVVSRKKNFVCQQTHVVLITSGLRSGLRCGRKSTWTDFIAQLTMAFQKGLIPGKLVFGDTRKSCRLKTTKP